MIVKTRRVNRKWWVLLENKIEMMGAADCVAGGMEQSWITAHVFQLTCLLTDVSCPTCGETGLYIQCVRDRIRGLDSHQSLL